MPAPQSKLLNGKRFWLSGVYNDKIVAEALANQIKAGGKAYSRISKVKGGWAVWWRARL